MASLNDGYGWQCVRHDRHSLRQPCRDQKPLWVQVHLKPKEIKRGFWPLIFSIFSNPLVKTFSKIDLYIIKARFFYVWEGVIIEDFIQLIINRVCKRC